MRFAVVLVLGAAGAIAGLVPGDRTASAAAPAVVTGGTLHSCAVMSDGGLRCWGNNATGQLGDGTIESRMEAAEVAGLGGDVRNVASSTHHTCAVTQTGKAVCWGRNTSGELGDGLVDNTRSLVPVDVIALDVEVDQISTGVRHTCARTVDGRGLCWGWNGLGAVGPGVDEFQPAPVEVPGLGSILGITAAEYHSCAVTESGGARCWGEDLGTSVQDISEIDGELLTGAVAIDSGTRHNCVLTVDATVRCWGHNYYGQRGTGSTTATQEITTTVREDGEPLTDVVAMTMGGHHSCALTEAGGVWCWGFNISGQVGDGTTTNRPYAIPVPGLASGVVSVGAARNHTCAVLLTGAVRCWGQNDAGQAGAETTDECGPLFAYPCARTPVDVRGIEPDPATQAGDADCDGASGSRDAALVLQFDAKLVSYLGCAAQADTNGDGRVTSRDAVIILQAVAGLTAL